MLYFDIYPTKRQAIAQFEYILSIGSSDLAITKIQKTGIPTIWYEDGDQLMFITDYQYILYCKGITYKIVGEDGIFHSGYKFNDREESK